MSTSLQPQPAHTVKTSSLLERVELTARCNCEIRVTSMCRDALQRHYPFSMFAGYILSNLSKQVVCETMHTTTRVFFLQNATQ